MSDNPDGSIEDIGEGGEETVGVVTAEALEAIEAIMQPVLDDDESQGDVAVDDDSESSSDHDPVVEAARNPLPELVHGCEHYRRRCKKRMPCCGEAFWCRHCHNEVKNDMERDPKKQHVLDRHSVTHCICALCGHEQTAKQDCEKCGVRMGNYYCDICKFWDDDTRKQQYHCDKCGICRVGGRDNFFHCDRCGSCIGLALKDNHTCIEKALHSDCPICRENLFESTTGVQLLKCGHAIHAQCLKTFFQNRLTSCPICKVSLYNMEDVWEALDEDIASTPMPEEYREVDVAILCNDCHSETTTRFHVLGLKCKECGSYNTART